MLEEIKRVQRAQSVGLPAHRICFLLLWRQMDLPIFSTSSILRALLLLLLLLYPHDTVQLLSPSHIRT
uniref:Uncharacterized protein n=1 Tax=Rhizophora mucronata TaxID=61149 RepID=A0A2P2MM56_RHIMU